MAIEVVCSFSVALQIRIQKTEAVKGTVKLESVTSISISLTGTCRVYYFVCPKIHRFCAFSLELLWRPMVFHIQVFIGLRRDTFLVKGHTQWMFSAGKVGIFWLDFAPAHLQKTNQLQTFPALQCSVAAEHVDFA